jgi:hypothetical protein
MSRFHDKKVSYGTKEAHANWMGGPSFDIKNPILALRIAASSSFFGEPMYYHKDGEDKRPTRASTYGSSYARVSPLDAQDISYLRETLDAVDPADWRSKTPAELMESAIDKALDFNVEATLQEAARLRNEEHIRTTPQVILVRAAHHKGAKGTGLVRRYAEDIIKRADEPSVGLAYHEWRYGKNCPIPNSLKKAWREALSTFNEYELAKYRMESKGTKTVDVVNLVHPKSDVVSKLMKSELKTTDQTWEAIISANGSNTASWTKAVEVMGHMALLRNLRNLASAGVSEKLYLDKLIDGVEKGKQLPFRYYSAYNAIKGQPNVTSRMLDAVEECIEKSFCHMPHFDGRVMGLCDNSGSAHGTFTSSMGSMKVAQIANLTAVMAARCGDDGHVGIFGDRLETFQVRRKSSIFEQTEKADSIGLNIGQETENGIWLFWDKAIKNKEKWDHVFIFSDMQAGHGGLYGINPASYANYLWGTRNKSSGIWTRSTPYIDVPKLISTYRAQVNPNVMVYCVQVAGYTDTIVPEFYKRTFILGGWGEGLFRFAAEMSNAFTPKQ